MASVVIRRHASKNRGKPLQNTRQDTELDRCEKMISMSFEDVADLDIASPDVLNQPLSEVPIGVAADSLLGKMPTTDKSMKSGELDKLTSNYEWKPMKVALTAAGIYLGQPEEV